MELQFHWEGAEWGGGEEEEPGGWEEGESGTGSLAREDAVAGEDEGELGCHVAPV